MRMLVIAIELIARGATLTRFGAWLPEFLIDAGCAGGAILALTAARMLMWGSRWSSVRLVLAGATVVTLFETHSTAPSYVMVISAAYAAVLLTSVACPDQDA